MVARGDLGVVSGEQKSKREVESNPAGKAKRETHRDTSPTRARPWNRRSHWKRSSWHKR